MPIPALMGTSTHLKREEVPSLDLNFDGTTSSATGDPHFDNVLINLDGTRTTANLLPSIDMSDQTFWQRNTNLGVTSGQTDPFGGTQAHFLNDQNTTSFSSLRETITGVAPGDYTASVYIKKTATAASKFRLRLWLGPLVTGTPTAECAVDTQNGLVSGDPTAKIEVVNSTYYRVSVTGTNVDQTELSLDFIPANAQTYTGAPDANATGGHTLYKPQIEAGSVATNALIIEGTLTTGTTDGSTIAHPFGNSPVPYIEYGSGADYQRVPLSVDLSGGDWTMEMWARFDSVASYRSILSSGYNGGWQFGIAPSTTQLQFDYSSVSVLHTTSLSTGQWYYVTLSYVDATNTIYVGVDGVVVSGSNAAFGTVTSQLLGGSNAASASVGAGHAFVIGSNRGHNAPHYGQLTQVRITKGVARYVQTFGNPTTYPPTAKDASVGTRLATSIVTQQKGGSVQSKYMGQHGKLISGYVENKSPNRDPDAAFMAGTATHTKTTGQPAPDGSNTAVLFTSTGYGSIYGVDTNVTFTQGEHYTLSCYMKVVTGTVIVGPLLTLHAFGGNTATYERAQYTISAGGGAPVQHSGYRLGSGDYGIQDVGDGWYRLWVSAQADFTARFTSPLSNAGNQVFRIDSASVGDEILVWGLQFEEGVRVPSEFVDATADQVARVEYGNFRTNFLPESHPYGGSWTTSGTYTVTDNYGAAPDGSTTSVRYQYSTANGFQQFYRNSPQAPTAGTVYTASIWYRGSGGFKLNLDQNGVTGANTNATFTATTTWQRAEVQHTAVDSGHPNYLVGTLLLHVWFQGATGDADIEFWGAQIEEGSSATDYIATYDGARTVGEPLGLLVEEGRTNIRPYSTATSLAVAHTNWTGSGGEWSAFNSNDTLSFSTAPDGTNTAVRMQLPVNSNQLVRLHAGSNYTLAAGETQTVSFWIKDRLTTSGYVLVESYADTVTGRKFVYQADRPQNQWVRITHTFTNNTGSDISKLAIDIHGDNSTVYDFDLWGFQLEVGEGATSYIPTDSTSLLRPADDITLATSDFGFNTAAGTTAAEFTMREATDNYPRVYEVSSNTNNRDSIFYAAPSTSLRAEVKESASSTAWTLASSVTFPFSAKAIVRHDGSNGVAALGGTLGTAQSITTAPSTNRTRVALGLNADLGGNNMNGHIRRLRYWPRAVNDAQLSKFTNE